VQGELVEIGYVIRTHGVKGHVRIAFDDNCKELSVSEALYFLIKGVHMPHFISEISHFNNGDALVLLEELHNKEEADLYTKRPVFGPAEWLEDTDEDQEIAFEGWKIHDETYGELGQIIASADMGAYLLLTVSHQGRELLVPMHDHLIIREDESSETLFTKLPEGLTDL